MRYWSKMFTVTVAILIMISIAAHFRGVNYSFTVGYVLAMLTYRWSTMAESEMFYEEEINVKPK